MLEEHGCSGTLPQLRVRLYRDDGLILSGFGEVLEMVPKGLAAVGWYHGTAATLGITLICPHAIGRGKRCAGSPTPSTGLASQPGFVLVEKRSHRLKHDTSHPHTFRGG